jgi:peptidoglycan-associated lipoprotein
MQFPSAGRTAAALAVLLLIVSLGACAKKQQPPVARPMPPPSPAATPPAGYQPVAPVEDPVPVPPEPLMEDPLVSRTLDELNRESPLQPVFFEFDSGEIGPEGRAVLDSNAEILRQYATWVVMIEGHCDERGTAEYNLALGERRALAARSYLVSLGIAPDRLRPVSYGEEFPFEPGHDESAWAKNRRAHFVITAK